jgi:hypothetical protein
MKVTASEVIGAAMCDALGLDKMSVTSLTLTLVAHDEAKLTVTSYVPGELVDTLTETLRTYRLVPIDDEAKP